MGFYEDTFDIEGVAFQRKDNGTWDVFFNGFKDNSEYAAMVNESCQTDECFGVLLFNSTESEVVQRFHEWVRCVLLPYRN